MGLAIIKEDKKYKLVADTGISIPIDIDKLLSVGLVTTWDTKVIGETTVLKSNPNIRTITIKDKATKQSIDVGFFTYQDFLRKLNVRKKRGNL